MKKTIIVCCALLLSACASSTMKTYVRQPISEVMAEYGPPDFVIDTAPNQKTFVWRKIATETEPAVIESGKYDDHFERTRVSRTTIKLPEENSITCQYAFYTQNVGSGQYASDWVITGFKKPNFSCEQYL